MLLLPQQPARFFMVNGGKAACRKSHNLAYPFFSAAVAKKAERKPVPVGMICRFLCQRLAHFYNLYCICFGQKSQNLVIFWVDMVFFLDHHHFPYVRLIFMRFFQHMVKVSEGMEMSTVKFTVWGFFGFLGL
jgi:hypothetical protein